MFGVLAVLLLGATQIGLAQHPDHAAAVVEEERPESSTAPSYCNPCFYYGGDFDPSSSIANAFTDGTTANTIAAAEVFVPFVVPTGQR